MRQHTDGIVMTDAPLSAVWVRGTNTNAEWTLTEYLTQWVTLLKVRTRLYRQWQQYFNDPDSDHSGQSRLELSESGHGKQ
jgi:hypothetical protein